MKKKAKPATKVQVKDLEPKKAASIKGGVRRRGPG